MAEGPLGVDRPFTESELQAIVQFSSRIGDMEQGLIENVVDSAAATAGGWDAEIQRFGPDDQMDSVWVELGVDSANIDQLAAFQDAIQQELRQSDLQLNLVNVEIVAE